MPVNLEGPPLPTPETLRCATGGKATDDEAPDASLFSQLLLASEATSASANDARSAVRRRDEPAGAPAEGDVQRVPLLVVDWAGLGLVDPARPTLRDSSSQAATEAALQMREPRVGAATGMARGADLTGTMYGTDPAIATGSPSHAQALRLAPGPLPPDLAPVADASSRESDHLLGAAAVRTLARPADPRPADPRAADPRAADLVAGSGTEAILQRLRASATSDRAATTTASKRFTRSDNAAPSDYAPAAEGAPHARHAAALDVSFRVETSTITRSDDAPLQEGPRPLPGETNGTITNGPAANSGLSGISARTTAASAPAAATITVHTPVGEPGWAQELAGRFAHVALRHDRIEIRVAPADLGPIDIRVDLKADQATLAIIAPHPATRDALEQALPQLRETLAAQGIALGQTSIQDPSAHASRDQAPSRPREDAGDATAARDVASLPPVSARRRPDRLVDTFA